MSQFPGGISMMDSYKNLFFSTHSYRELFVFVFVFGENCTIYLQSVVFMVLTM